MSTSELEAATVTYSINTSKVSQTASVAEWVLVLIITLINLSLVWTHYKRSYGTFCAQRSDAERAELIREELKKAIANRDEEKQELSDAEREQLIQGGGQDSRSAQVPIPDDSGQYSADSALLAMLTCFSLTCYFLGAVYTLIIESATKTPTFCVSYVVPIVWMFTLARGLQFNVYLARLDFLYHGTKGEYAKSTLMSLATVVVIIVIILMSLQAAYQEETVLFINNDQFPYFCEFLLKSNSLVSMLVFDVVLSIVSVILFWIPLGQVAEEKDESTKKLLKRFGWKYAVIVTLTSSWTVVNYVLLIVTNTTLLAPTMLLMNSLSLVLLGPYYSVTLKGVYGALGFGTIVDMQQAIKRKQA
eukprot:CAMPEP_0197021050 /NCGR_PEP_ID=MMETSP1384-20130603/1943_1 /TAXON_ID=29189 /ORGANISM="Ammonia sp." /LENGTH=359 /DNA_ID=CAMNT_0042448797 /DNA_START=57 /DNA_END=1136 /DNA_ORIENTATION=-